MPPQMLCVVNNGMVHRTCHRLLQGVSASVLYCVTPGGKVAPNHQLQVTHLRQVACILHCKEGIGQSTYICASFDSAVCYPLYVVEVSSELSGVLCLLRFNAERVGQLHCQLGGTCVPLATESSCLPHPECKHKCTQQLPPGLRGLKALP